MKRLLIVTCANYLLHYYMFLEAGKMFKGKEMTYEGKSYIILDEINVEREEKGKYFFSFYAMLKNDAKNYYVFSGKADAKKIAAEEIDGKDIEKVVEVDAENNK